MNANYRIKYQRSSGDGRNTMLRGTGSLSVSEDVMTFEGSKRSFWPFWGAKQTLSISREAVFDVAGHGKSISFEYSPDGDEHTGHQAFVFYAATGEEAEQIKRWLPTRVPPEFEKARAEIEQFRSNMAAAIPRAYVTYSLVALNITAFVLTIIAGSGIVTPDTKVLIAYGANMRALTTDGEWWRLLSSAFLHAGIMHLAFNMWALLTFGVLVERLFGSSFFLLIYIVSAFLGGISSIIWADAVVSVGASGAIFGVCSALMAYLLTQRESVPASMGSGLWKSALFFAGYNVFYGFSHAGIDNAAHVGGLAGGFVMGLALARPLGAERRSRSMRLRLLTGAGVGAAAIVLAVSAVPKSPFSYKQASSLHDRAAAFLGKGEYDKAVANYSEVLRMNPSDKVAYVNRGIAYDEQGKYDEAISDCTRALAIDPKLAEAYINRGVAYEKKDQLDLAISDFTGAIEINPKLAKAYMNRGVIYEKKGQFDRAVSDYSSALELDPKYAGAYNSRGWLLGEKGNYDEAISDYTRALEIDPKYANAYSNRGVAYVRKGRYDLAIADCTSALEINPKIAPAFNNRGLAYGAQGQYDKAIADYTMALEIDPKFAMAYLNRGVVYAEKEGQLDQAISDYTMALEINPKYANAYNNRGLAYIRKGQYDLAIADCTRALEINPGIASAYNNRGLSYGRKGEYDRAIADYTRALEIDPNMAEACYNRGLALAEKGDYDLAIADYTRALEIAPKYSNAYGNRIMAYTKKGEFDKAWEDVHRAETLGLTVNQKVVQGLRDASGREN